MTFTEIQSNIQQDLADAGVSYTAAELLDSLDDAYQDIAFQTRCIIKKVSAQAFTANLAIYDFSNFASDYLQVRAIFEIGSNRWMDDSITLKQMDRLDCKWETRVGTPENWFPLNHQYVGIFPKPSAAGRTFDLIYSAVAPAVVLSAEPLVATDMTHLFNMYCVADLLESYGEFKKAQQYWAEYFPMIESYKERVQNITKSDLLILL